MSEASHGGKGDRARKTDMQKYRESNIWKKSACCGANVKISGNGKDYWCVKCCKLTKTKTV